MTSLGKIIDTIVGALPVPKTLLEGTWFVIGWMAANAFGKSLDEGIMEKINGSNSEFVKDVGPLVSRILHFVHHFWIGMLGVVYFGVTPIAQSIGLPISIPQSPNAELFWVCLGMALEDAQYHLRVSMGDGILSRVFKTK